MAIRGVSLSERETVILKTDPGHPDHAEYKLAVAKGVEPEKPTEFIIGNLTQGCRIELGDMVTAPTLTRDGGVVMDNKRTKRAYAVVQRGLHGWTNMLDSEGKVLPFGDPATVQTATGFVPGASFAAMSALTSETIFELATLILEKNGLTKGLSGNSEGASPQSPVQLSPVGTAKDAPNSSNGNEAA